MNEVKIKNEILPELEEMGNVRIEGSRNPKMNENNFKNLHAQRTFWRGNNIIALCWAFYYVNDNKEINVTTFQLCIVFIAIIIQY
jgi:hypothetical protein